MSCDNGVQDKAITVFSDEPLVIEKVLDHIGENPTETERYFVGNYYLENGLYEKSITFFDKIIAQNEELLLEAKYAKVSALIKLQNGKAAKALLETLPTTERNKVPFLEAMLMADFVEDNWTPKTSYYYANLKSVHNSSAVFRYMDIVNNLSKKDTSKALENLNKLRIEYPGDLKLKLLYLKLNCCGDSTAIDMITDLIKSNSNNKKVQEYYLDILVSSNLLDSAYKESGRYAVYSLEKNKKLLDQLIANKNPNARRLLSNLTTNKRLSKFDIYRYEGDLSYKEKKYYNARSQYIKARELKPDNDYIKRQVGLLNWRIKSMSAQSETNTI